MKLVSDEFRLSASDLVGHLSCAHLTELEKAVARGEIDAPDFWDPGLATLWGRGLEHEADYVAHLANDGLEVETIEGFDISAASVAATTAAMKDGRPVIVQAGLQHGQWIGRADVLRRVEVPSALGVWSYEVLDTKLARETKGSTVLQICLYSDLVSHVQGVAPEHMYVVPPWTDFEPYRYRVADYAAYYRYVRRSLESAVSAQGPIETYPEPNSHCEICRWRFACAQKRREDDHLSLVAGISKIQIVELEGHDIRTTGQLAGMPLPLGWKPERGSANSYSRVREQARVQVEGRVAGELRFEGLPFEPGFGLSRLPAPSQGDVFLDFESDPYVGEHGLEYLLGYHYRNEAGEWTYNASWALTRQEEKAAFEAFIDFIMATTGSSPPATGACTSSRTAAVPATWQPTAATSGTAPRSSAGS